MNASLAVETVEAKLSASLLMKPSILFRTTLGLAPDLNHEKFKSLVKSMYHLAVAKDNWAWVEQAQVEAKAFFGYDWILSNLPHKFPQRNKVHLRTSVVQEYDPGQVCRDVRLRSVPGLSVVQVDMGCHSGQDEVEVSAVRQGDTFHPPMETEGCDTGMVAVVGENDSSPCKSYKNNSMKTMKSEDKNWCPFPKCQAIRQPLGFSLKYHVKRAHLPYLFWNNLTPEELELPAIQAGRAEGIELMARWIVGSADSLEALVERVNSTQTLVSELGSEKRPEFEALCKYKGWPVPLLFTLTPVNSPACLIHWRCLIILLNSISTRQYQELCVMSGKYRKHTAARKPRSKKKSAVSREESDSMLQLPGPGALSVTITNDSMGSGLMPASSPSVIVVPASPSMAACGATSVPEVYPSIPDEFTFSDQAFWAIDSHMHLDRMGSSLKCASPIQTLDEIRSLRPQLYPQVQVKLRGIVAVHCDPDTYPSRVFPSDEVKVAIGLHPRKVGLFDVAREKLFASLIQDPAVVALGEVGFDLTEPSQTWDKQLSVLRKVLAFSSVAKPLVLHIRSNPYKVTCNPYEKVFEIVQDYCGRLQPIHLHCFGGTTEDVEPWMQTFPNCYFGFTASVDFFSSEQVQGLKSVPLERILLETDSPYLCPRGRKQVNTPIFIGDVGLLVARKKMVSLSELMRSAFENARKLYKFT